MAQFLIMRLDGPMQAWGTHTYEDFRPSNLFPTRSGLLGLLGACIGIERKDRDGMEQLAGSVEFAVRVDKSALRAEDGRTSLKSHLKFPDYHTVRDARRANRAPKEGETIQSRREYLYDAAFTVAIGARSQAAMTLDAIAPCLRLPRYSPVLGRRSCPIARPLLDANAFVEADDAKVALSLIMPTGGLIYTEGELQSKQPMQIRDVPLHGKHRQFGTRRIYVHRDDVCS